MHDGQEKARAFAHVLDALRNGQTEAAEALARDLLREKPTDPGVHQLLGAVASQKGDWAEAEHWASASLAARPHHAATWIMAGRAALAVSQDAVALERFARAAALEPARPDAAFGAAIARATLHPDTVDDIVATLARQHPDHRPGWIELGATLERHARWAGAAQAFTMALRGRPSAKLYVRLGTALQALGRRGEAAAVLGQALALDPAAAEAWFRLGLVLQDGRQIDGAIDAYRRALALHPGLVEAHTNLGIALQERGDLPGAKRAYGHALALRPSVFGRIAQALTTAPHGELWLDLAALRDHLSEGGRLSR